MATIAVCLMAPQAAHASSVRLSPDGETLIYEAAAGEENFLFVELEAGEYSVTDSGWMGDVQLSVAAGPGCSTNSVDHARCAAADVIALNISVGDQSDEAIVNASTTATILGGGGEDFLVGGTKHDTLAGEDGNDYLLGGDGADSLSGGAGSDMASYEDHVDAVIADVGGGTNDGSAEDGPEGARDNVQADVEGLIGGDGDDVLTGDGGANVLDGGFGGANTLNGLGGNDELFGGDGNDALNGGDGADLLEGLQGADSFSGGSGFDTASYEYHWSGVVADIGGGHDDGNTEDGPPGARDSVGTDVEGLTGTYGDDALSGDSGANAIAGGEGSDTLTGGEGVDALSGGEGTDMIRSRDSAADQVACGTGVDWSVADGLDSVGADCEFIDRPSPASAPPISSGPPVAKKKKSCKGLKGKKLSRCKRTQALAKCKKLKGKKKKACTRRAKRVGRR